MVTVGHPTDKAQKKLSWLGRPLGCAGAMAAYKYWVGIIGAILGLGWDMHLSSYSLMLIKQSSLSPLAL